MMFESRLNKLSILHTALLQAAPSMCKMDKRGFYNNTFCYRFCYCIGLVVVVVVVVVVIITDALAKVMLSPKYVLWGTYTHTRNEL